MKAPYVKRTGRREGERAETKPKTFFPDVSGDAKVCAARRPPRARAFIGRYMLGTVLLKLLWVK